MSEERNSTSPSAIRVKNRRKTVCIHIKLYVISRHEKSEQIVDTWRNFRFGHCCMCTIRDNAGKIMESVKSGTKVIV